MDVTKAVKVALNTLVDIASHSRNGQLVPAPEIAKRQHLSVSRIELLLRPLRESGLIISVKGRAGGYLLSKDPRIITIKDVVLAMNLIKKRKVELSDVAKDLYQSLETYMLSCMANVSLASTIKDYVPSFSDVKKAPERKIYVPLSSKKEGQKKGTIQKVVNAEFKRADKVPRGPNSVFDFANYLDRRLS